MPYHCAVPFCRANYTNGPKVSMFQFPKDEEVKRKWLKFINRENFTPSKGSRLCQQHFLDSDVETETKVFDTQNGIEVIIPLELKRLKKSAVPSVSKKYPSYRGHKKANKESYSRKPRKAKMRKKKAQQVQQVLGESIADNVKNDGDRQLSNIEDILSCVGVTQCQVQAEDKRIAIEDCIPRKTLLNSTTTMDITLCVCCLLLPPEKDLKSKNVFEDSTEIYSDMLSDCFNITLTPEILLSESNPGICHVCVQQLRAAVKFKKQILTCQKLLQTHIKEEKVEEEDPECYYQSLQNAQAIDPLLHTIKEIEDDFDCNNDGDTKMVTLDNDSDEDDINLLLLAKVKELQQSKKTVTDNAGPKVKKRNADDQGKITLATSPTSDMKKPKPSIIPEDPMPKQKHNHHTLIKNSNAIPFSDKIQQGYRCAYCSDTYRLLQDLRQHTITQHSNDEITFFDKRSVCLYLDISDLTCSICDENCDLIDDLKTHLTSKHNIKLYDDVKDHIVEFKIGSCHDGDMMQCALCQSSFETFRTLLIHMNNHYRNFVCEVCDLGFINLVRLQHHLRSHVYGNYKCSYCGKFFPSKVRLKAHEQHTHRRRKKIVNIFVKQQCYELSLVP